MFEVQFYGRGGQGLYLASQILAQAVFLDGKFPQSFPEFTAERRGAPISAFLRIDTKPIRERCKIYRPDAVLIFDYSFLDHLSEIVETIKPNGWCVVNSEEDVTATGDIVLARVDADEIARAEGLCSVEGHAMGNMTMLGAFCRLTNMATLESLIRAIREKIPRMPEENVRVALAGYEQLIFQKVTIPPTTPSSKKKKRSRPIPFSPVSISGKSVKGAPTKAWRTADPVFTEKCTGCKICSLFCPEGIIQFDATRKGSIDLDFCKGCWICIEVCPVKGAIVRREKGDKK